MRSSPSNHEAVIELELADGRTAKDLRNTLHDQLVTKYMAADTKGSGYLKFTLSKDRKCDHPDTAERIGLDELVALLTKETADIAEKLHVPHWVYVPACPLKRSGTSPRQMAIKPNVSVARHQPIFGGSGAGSAPLQWALQTMGTIVNE